MFTHLRPYFLSPRSVAIGGVFASMGFLFGNWVTHIPYIKSHFGLNDAQLGVLLLSMPLGSTLFNPVVTVLLRHFGMRSVTVWGMVLMAVMYALPVNMPVLWGVSVALAGVGVSISTTNIAMNTCVMAIEKHERITVMATCHGMFSLGGMLGSFVASFLTGARVAASWQMIGAGVLVVVLALFIKKNIYQIYEEPTNDPSGAAFVWPKGILLGMIAVSLCTNITEGAMADWTAVYMREIVAASPFFMGWGFAGYALFMALGRFMGDMVIPRFGRSIVLVLGGILTTLGILIVVFLPHTMSAIVGFAFVGAGVSCGAPILYSSSLEIPNMAKGAGLATLNTFSIAGFLAGPAIIGFISNAANLVWGIGLVGVLGLLWAFLAHRVPLNHQ
jgi:MFS family permease